MRRPTRRMPSNPSVRASPAACSAGTRRRDMSAFMSAWARRAAAAAIRTKSRATIITSSSPADPCQRENSSTATRPTSWPTAATRSRPSCPMPRPMAVSRCARSSPIPAPRRRRRGRMAYRGRQGTANRARRRLGIHSGGRSLSRASRRQGARQAARSRGARGEAVTQKLNRAEAVARSRKLAAVLRERAAQGEKLRRMPDETVVDLIDSGLLRLCQPARFGGSELGWDVLCESSIELGQGDGSQAWVANIYGEHAMFVSLFEDEAQHEVWDLDPNTLICASIIPPGNKVEPACGGFRLTGRWSFASGVHHARWIILGDGVAGDVKEARLFLVPKVDY